MKKIKKLLLTMAVISLMMSCLVIVMGLLEMYFNITKPNNYTSIGEYMTHGTIALLIITFCNIMIAAHIVYLAQYTLRGFRYSWYVSCNYFMYVLCEIVAAVVVFTKFEYFQYPVAFAVAVGVLFVILFFFTCVVEKIFNDLEDQIAIESEEAMYRKLGQQSPKSKKKQCVTVSLRGSRSSKDSTTLAPRGSVTVRDSSSAYSATSSGRGVRK